MYGWLAYLLAHSKHSTNEVMIMMLLKVGLVDGHRAKLKREMLDMRSQGRKLRVLSNVFNRSWGAGRSRDRSNYQ